MHVNNFFEDCIWNKKGEDLRNNLINFGYFNDQEQVDLLFSPHILLVHRKPYVMELEKINWLFADDYQHTVDDVPRWKVTLFEQLALEDNLKTIMWYSESALKDFEKTFVPQYRVSQEVVKKIMSVSQVVMTASAQLNREKENLDTARNEFVMIVDNFNWYRKGLDVVFAIFARLADSLPKQNWNLKVVGGKIPNEIKTQYGNFGGRVAEIGRISSDQVSALFARASCLLSPSRADTFGAVLVQAINSGCFVIASVGKNVLAAKEILEGYRNAIVIKSQNSDVPWLDKINVDAFHDAIKNLVLHPKQLSNQRSPRFSRERLRDQIKKIFS